MNAHRCTIAMVLLLGIAACPDGEPNESDSETEPDDGAPQLPDADSQLRLDFVPLDVDDSFDCPTDFAFLPGTSDLLLTRKDGKVERFTIDGDALVRRASVEVPETYNEQDCGTLSIALDPAFADNSLFYVGACVSQTHSVIWRMQWSDDPQAVTASAVEVIRVGDDTATRPWHNVGSIGFDAKGYLWAVFGDKSVRENGQLRTTELSALVRIEPNRDPAGSGHTPAPDNPFAGMADVNPSIYAYGFRSPWKASVDAKGRYWVGDVGASAAEEINVVTAPGQNFGWGDHEGPCAENCESVVDPVTHYFHEEITDYMLEDDEVADANGRAVWVGEAYRDQGNDPYHGRLIDKVLFGDVALGFVRALGADEAGVASSDEHMGHLRHAVGARQGPDGHMYLATLGKCDRGPERPDAALYRAEPRWE